MNSQSHARQPVDMYASKDYLPYASDIQDYPETDMSRDGREDTKNILHQMGSAQPIASNQALPQANVPPAAFQSFSKMSIDPPKFDSASRERGQPKGLQQSMAQKIENPQDQPSNSSLGAINEEEKEEEPAPAKPKPKPDLCKNFLPKKKLVEIGLTPGGPGGEGERLPNKNLKSGNQAQEVKSVRDVQAPNEHAILQQQPKVNAARIVSEEDKAQQVKSTGASQSQEKRPASLANSSVQAWLKADSKLNTIIFKQPIKSPGAHVSSKSGSERINSSDQPAEKAASNLNPEAFSELGQNPKPGDGIAPTASKAEEPLEEQMTFRSIPQEAQEEVKDSVPQGEDLNQCNFSFDQDFSQKPTAAEAQQTSAQPSSIYYTGPLEGRSAVDEKVAPSKSQVDEEAQTDKLWFSSFQGPKMQQQSPPVEPTVQNEPLRAPAESQQHQAFPRQTATQASAQAPSQQPAGATTQPSQQYPQPPTEEAKNQFPIPSAFSLGQPQMPQQSNQVPPTMPPPPSHQPAPSQQSAQPQATHVKQEYWSQQAPPTYNHPQYPTQQPGTHYTHQQPGSMGQAGQAPWNSSVPPSQNHQPQQQPRHQQQQHTQPTAQDYSSKPSYSQPQPQQQAYHQPHAQQRPHWNPQQHPRQYQQRQQPPQQTTVQPNNQGNPTSYPHQDPHAEQMSSQQHPSYRLADYQTNQVNQQYPGGPAPKRSSSFNTRNQGRPMNDNPQPNPAAFSVPQNPQTQFNSRYKAQPRPTHHHQRAKSNFTTQQQTFVQNTFQPQKFQHQSTAQDKPVHHPQQSQHQHHSQQPQHHPQHQQQPDLHRTPPYPQPEAGLSSQKPQGATSCHSHYGLKDNSSISNAQMTTSRNGSSNRHPSSRIGQEDQYEMHLEAESDHRMVNQSCYKGSHTHHTEEKLEYKQGEPAQTAGLGQLPSGFMFSKNTNRQKFDPKK